MGSSPSAYLVYGIIVPDEYSHREDIGLDENEDLYDFVHSAQFGHKLEYGYVGKIDYTEYSVIYLANTEQWANWGYIDLDMDKLHEPSEEDKALLQEVVDHYQLYNPPSEYSDVVNINPRWILFTNYG